MRDANGKVVKQPKVFDIDYSVCMGCQICVEACPFDAIKMDHNYELSTDNRFHGLLIDKKGLAKSNAYFHSIKPLEATEVDRRLAEEAAKKKKPAAAAKPVASSTSTPKPTMASATPPANQGIVVPPDAPFSPEQREWLQKFLGQISVGAPRATGSSVASVTPSGEGQAEAPVEEEAAENPDLSNDAPWHDPDKDLSSRMKMAEGKPIAVKLYAAMGQTDCTACGYDCKGYAMALAAGVEKDPHLCVPGADETAAKVKDLLDEAGIKV
jgi:ferredoxin